METTERIVEAYVRYIKGWATIPNVRCTGQNEIDLIAIDPIALDRYHIEVSISISQGFRKLTARSYDPDKAKQRVHHASQRRTVGFFGEKKFSAPGVVERLRQFGFEPGQYSKVIVTWGWEDDALSEAKKAGIDLWDFREIISEIADSIRGSRQYFGDDTLRTLNLFIHAAAEGRREKAPALGSAGDNELRPGAPRKDGDAFWVYENWVHKLGTVHRGSCSFCNEGRGLHADRTDDNSQWFGPFDSIDAAIARTRQTRSHATNICGICLKHERDSLEGYDA